MLLLRSFLFLIFLSLSLLCYSQKKTVLTEKLAPAKLQEDATLLRNVVLAMHPAVGIYRTRTYYTDLFDSYVHSITDSMTERDFRLKTKLVVEELHCGHTEVIYSNAYYRAINKQKLNYSPYVFIPIQNKLYVLVNLNKKMDSTLKRGTEINAINGIAVDSLLRHCRRFISTDGFNRSSKDHYLMYAFNSFYLSLFGRPDTFHVEYKEGSTIKHHSYAAIHTKSIPPIPLVPRNDSLFVKYRGAKMKYRFLDTAHQSLLLKLDGFSRKGANRAYRKIFRKLKKNKTQNFILDLRNNGGGSLENTYRLLSYLVDTSETQTLRTAIKKYPYKKYTHGNVFFKLTRFAFTLIGKKVSRNDTDNYIYTIRPRKKNHYNHRIYVLINGGSFSASCLVAAYLKYHSRAIFIGEETGGAMEGCNAGITPYYKLPNSKIKIRMPAFRVIHDVCPAVTGHGILPDYQVEYTIKDILAKRDLELAKVKELIKLNGSNSH